MNKPDKKAPAEEIESKQPKNSSVTEHEVPTKHNETYRNDNNCLLYTSQPDQQIDCYLEHQEEQYDKGKSERKE